ncbi:MAG: hypothetical protein EHM48_00405 [Planctomycetaceae bacterium]|nr:MAG: hypothetical protein EHM48_00405 [Planctomycetaceae bacterium]
MVAGTDLWVPGVDPTDPWTFGNIYHRDAAGVWSKIRTQPNAIHTFGLLVDGGYLYACTGSHTGDSVTWCGQVLRSGDGGQTWDEQVTVTGFRIYHIIKFAGKLYAYGNNLSSDVPASAYVNAGAGWAFLATGPLKVLPRMVTFGDRLVLAGNSNNVYAVHADGSVTEHSSPTVLATSNPMFAIGSSLFVLGMDGYVWRTTGLSSWQRYTYVPGAISLGVSPDGSLLISDSGASVRIWKASII